MSQPGSLGRGEGAVGLDWLLDHEPGGCRGRKQAGLDLVGEDAAGDQAVEADPGPVQSVVAAALRGVGDSGEFLLEGHLAVGMAGGSRLEAGH
jgi:hypothetical protein